MRLLNRYLVYVLFFVILGCGGNFYQDDSGYCTDDSNCRMNDMTKTHDKKKARCEGTFVPPDCFDSPGEYGGRDEPMFGGDDDEDEPKPEPKPAERPNEETDGDQEDDSHGAPKADGSADGAGDKGPRVDISEIGDTVEESWKGFVDGVDNVMGELDGRNKKKREKARRIQSKIEELQQIGAQLNELEDALVDTYDNLSLHRDKVNAVSSQFDFDRIKGDLDNSRALYNSRIEKILTKYPEDNSGALDSVADPNNYTKIYPEAEKVSRGKAYIDTVGQAISTQEGAPTYDAQLKAIGYAKGAMNVAEEYYKQGDPEAGNVAYEVGITLADTALSLTPGVSWAKDGYEALTGRNMVTGEELSTFDRTFAIMGLVSGGILSKIGTGIKSIRRGYKIYDKISDAGGAINKVSHLAEISSARKMHEAASEAGVLDPKKIEDVAEIVKKNLPCSKVSDNISTKLIKYAKLLFENTAYADVPCDISKVAEKTAEIFESTGEILKSSRRPAKAGAEESRALQALKKKIDRGDQAFKDLPKTQEQAETLIFEIFAAKDKIVRTKIQDNMKIIDTFDKTTRRGVRTGDSVFDTFVNL